MHLINKQELEKPGEIAAGRPGGAATRRSAAAKRGAAWRAATAEGAALRPGQACFRLAQHADDAAFARATEEEEKQAQWDGSGGRAAEGSPYIARGERQPSFAVAGHGKSRQI